MRQVQFLSFIFQKPLFTDDKLIVIVSLIYGRQVQFLLFIFQNPFFTNDQLILITTLFIVMNAGKSVMMYCDVKVNVIMMLFVTCCFAYVIEKHDINKDREHEKLYSIHFGGREGCQVALCLKNNICEKNKMANG